MSDREFYERGWRWCECSTTWKPDGDRGYVPAVNLVPLQPAEFDVAQAALRRIRERFEHALELLFGAAIRRLD
jgi:hypothetical protein